MSPTRLLLLTRIIPQQQIQVAVRANFLFNSLPEEQLKEVVDAMEEKNYEPGGTIIKEGNDGDYFYVVANGAAEVFISGKNDGAALRSLKKGDTFGELALMYNSPRAATVVANQDSVVWMIDRFTFRRIVTGLSAQKFDVYVKFLKNVQLLMPLADYERRKIAEALEEVSFAAGHTVFRQGPFFAFSLTQHCAMLWMGWRGCSGECMCCI